MTTHTIYYAASGGDGSAYPRFFSSAKLAEWWASREEEGFADPIGSLTIDSDGPIKVSKLTTPESYLVELWGDHEDTEKFIAEFFPNGIPHFTTQAESIDHPDYHYLLVSADGVRVNRVFVRIAQTAEVAAQALNALSSGK